MPLVLVYICPLLFILKAAIRCLSKGCETLGVYGKWVITKAKLKANGSFRLQS